MTTETECGAEKWHGGRRVTCRHPVGHHGDHQGMFTYREDLKWSDLTGIDGAWERPEVVPATLKFSRGGYVKANPDLFTVGYTGCVIPTPAGEEALKKMVGRVTADRPEREEPTHETVMDAAKHLLNEDRYEDYGDPHENFARIAGMWSAYLGSRITADQVAVMMTLMKCSRLAHSPDHRDSYVDGVAYLAIAAELQEDHHE